MREVCADVALLSMLLFPVGANQRRADMGGAQMRGSGGFGECGMADGFWGQGGNWILGDVYVYLGMMRLCGGLRFVCLVQFNSAITNFPKEEEKTESYASDSSSSSQAFLHYKYEIV